MKDVPTVLPVGLNPGCCLERASQKDLLVFKSNTDFLDDFNSTAVIATSSIRRENRSG
jgi:hydroxymethylbilane synthase